MTVKPGAYAAYYNEVRSHLSLRKDAPKFRRVLSVGSLAKLPLLGGLHHQYFGFSFAQAQTFPKPDPRERRRERSSSGRSFEEPQRRSPRE
jgi:hypothetical protein